MAKRQIAVGSTSNILNVFIQDNASVLGIGKTGLTATITSLLCAYKRNTGAAVVDVTLTTQATLGSYDAAGFKEVSSTKMPGVYEFCPPDAAFVTGASSVVFYLLGATTTAAVVPLPIEIELTAVNIQDAVRAGLTALPNVVAGGDNGLPLGDANGDVTVGAYATTTVAPLQPIVPGRTIDIDIAGAVAHVGNVDNPVTVDAFDPSAITSIRSANLIASVALGINPPFTANTVDLPSIVGANSDSIVGMTLIHLNSARSLIQCRIVTDYDAAQGTVTVDRNWTVDPTDDDIIEFYINVSNNDKSGYALSASGISAIWDEVVEGVLTARQLVRGFFAALLGKSSGHVTGGPSTPKYRDSADSKNRIDATTDADGNRTGVTLDLS